MFRDPCKKEGRTVVVRDESGLLIIKSVPCKDRTMQLKCKDRFFCHVMTWLSIRLVSGTLLGENSPATSHRLSAVNG